MSFGSLSGQTAIVTGAAKRIGRSIAHALADAGADVLVHYGHSSAAAEATAKEICAKGVRSATVSADLSNPTPAAEAIFDACQTHLAPATILVNSAAIFDAGTIASTSQSDWDRHMKVNLEAPLRLIQAFADQVPESLDGSVTNIADWRAHVHPTGHLAYTISKTGLLALTRISAQELAPKIRVNAIAPGPMLPPPGKDDAYIAPVIDKLPLKRQGGPDDIARAVLYLVQADFVTGTLLHVDGGQQFSGGMA